MDAELACNLVLGDNDTFRAPAFYERHGYVETGRTEGLPMDGAADVHLAKPLG